MRLLLSHRHKAARYNMDPYGYVKIDAQQNSSCGVFMRLCGKFKLNKSTLALDLVNGKRVAVTVPTGAILEVVSAPAVPGDQLIDVIWEGRTVRMFALDVRERGIEVSARGATVGVHSETRI